MRRFTFFILSCTILAQCGKSQLVPVSKVTTLESGDDHEEDSNPDIKITRAEETNIDPDRFKHLKDLVVPDSNSTSFEFDQARYDRLKELREAWESEDLLSDTDFMKKCLETLRSESSSVEEIEAALQDLEDLVHQVDNAGDFIKPDGMNGLPTIFTLLKDPRAAISAHAAWVLASAAQNHQHVQRAVVTSGALSVLVGALEGASEMVNEREVRLAGKVVLALSAIIRGNLTSFALFSKLGGPVLLQNHLVLPAPESLGVEAQNVLESTRGKILSLVSDLFHLPIREGRTKELREQVFAEFSTTEWCSAIADTFLHRDNPNTLERSMLAMDALAQTDQCLDTFKQDNVVSRLKSLKSSIDNDAELLETCSSLLNILVPSKDDVRLEL
eukprot:248369_1